LLSKKGLSSLVQPGKARKDGKAEMISGMVAAIVHASCKKDDTQPTTIEKKKKKKKKDARNSEASAPRSSLLIVLDHLCARRFPPPTSPNIAYFAESAP